MMEIYLAGTAVALTVPLQDRSGNALDVASVEYRITKQDGSEVLARVALADFAGGAEAVVPVPAELNVVAAIDPAKITAATIDATNVREIRTVELFAINAAGNTVVISKSYALEPADTLIVGLNSFQSYAQAELTALDIPGLDGWSGATEQDKVAAMVEARLRINQLRFNLLNSNVNWGQDNLNYVPEGAYPTPYARMFMFNGNLSLITPSNFVKLPPRFRAALARAQVTEANAILGGDPVDVRRQEGLMLESIGEVKQMFRPSKPIDMPICKRALKYLSPFVSFSQRIGRG